MGLDDGDYNSGLDTAFGKFQGFAGKIGGVMAGVAKGFGVALGAGVTAFTAIGKKAFDLSAELEQSIGGIQTLFKNEFGDASELVIKNAEKAYLTAGLNANEYMQQISGFSASLLQSVGQDTEKAALIGDMAITDMADNANKMGTSIESIQNTYQGFAKQNYTMLDNLKLGYGGTKTEMERLLVDAQRINKEATGVDKVFNIDNLAEVYQAVHVIQKDMGILGSTAEEAGKTVSGSLTMLKGAFENLLMGIASPEEVVSAFEVARDNVMGSVMQILPNLTSALPKIFEGLAPMIPPILEQILPVLLQGGITLIGGLAQGIIQSAPILLTELGKVLIDLGNSILNYATPFIDKGKIVFDNFINGFVNGLPKSNETGKNLMENLINGITQTIPKIIEKAIPIIEGFIKGIKDNLPKLLNSGVDMVLGLMQGLENKRPELIKNGLDMISNLLKAIHEKLPDFIKWAQSTVLGMADKILEKGPSLLASMIGNIAMLITMLIAKLPEFLSLGLDIVLQIISGINETKRELEARAIKLIIDTLAILGDELLKGVDIVIEKAKEIGEGIITGIQKGIDNLKDKAVTSIKNVATNIIDGAKNIFNSNSPSKEFEVMGEGLPTGLAIGITAKEKKSIQAAEAMAKKTYDSAKTWIMDYKNDVDYMATEELKMWEILLEKHKNVSKEKVEIEKNIAKLKEEIAKEEFETSKKWIEKRAFFDMLSTEEQIEAWERVQARYKEGTQEREEIDRTIYTLKKQRISEVEQAEKTALEEQKKIAQEQEKLYKSQEDIVKKIADAEKNYTDAVNNRSEAIFNAFGLFDKLEEKQKEEKITGKELIENLKGQVVALRDWKADLEKLSQMGINKDLYLELAGKGPTAREEIEALSNLSQKDLEKYSTLWAEKHKEAREQSIKELDGMKIEMENTINGYLLDLAGTVGSDALEVGKIIADNINKGVKENLKPVTKTETKTTSSNVDVMPITQNMELIQNTFDVGFTEFGNVIVSKFAGMINQAIVLLNTMMDSVNMTLRVRGFEAGQIFIRSLGEGLIREKANLLAEALDVADAIVEIFRARENEKIRHAGEADYVPSWQKQETSTQNQIEQNLYFYGVREEQTAFEVQQALRRNAWEDYA